MEAAEVAKPEMIGNGDGRIQVNPSLSAPSIKNGEKLTISAVIKSLAAVVRIEPVIEEREEIDICSTGRGRIRASQ